METERIDLGSGDWWEVRTIVTYGMRKAFRAAGLRGFMGGLDGADLGDPEALKRAIMAHPEAWDLGAVDGAYLLHGTVAWSFKGKITMEAIEALPDAHVTRVLGRMQELYAEPTEAELKN